MGDGGFWKIPRPQLGYPQIIPQSYPRSGDNFDVAGLPVVEYNLRCSIYFYMKKFSSFVVKIEKWQGGHHG